MNISASELKAQITKASRGLGYDWGRANYIGEAVVYSERFQIPAVETLVAIADQLDPRGPSLDRINFFHGSRDPLDCISLGLGLMDHLPLIPSCSLHYRLVTGVPLLVGLLGYGLRARDRVIRLDVLDCTISIGAGLIGLNGNVPAVGACHIFDGPHEQLKYPISRFDIDDSIWLQLEQWSSRIYAPATEASRLSGAGAGLNDND